MENKNCNQQKPPPSPPPPPPPPLRTSSAASFAAQLFGDNDSHPCGMFASIFPKVAGSSNCLRCSQPIQYKVLDNQIWSTVLGTSAPDNVAKNAPTENSGVKNVERRSIFHERIEPCPLSSSIYYGGQEDMYIRSSSDLTSKSYTKFFTKDDSEDDPYHMQSATRGNWWQGSLYY